MEQILEIATHVSTPLALGGLFAAILFLILKQIIAKNIFPELNRTHGGDILKLIINRLFVLAFAAMVLGFVGFIFTTGTANKRTPDVVKVPLPDSMSLEEAINFLADIDHFTVAFKSNCDDIKGLTVTGGEIEAKSTIELIDLLRFRLKDKTKRIQYTVTKQHERGIYEVSCN